MPLKRGHVWKLFIRVAAVMDDASKVTKGETRFLRCVGVIVDGIILRVLFTSPLKFLVKDAPGQIFIFSDYYLVEIGFADWALLILQNQSQPK